MASVRFADLQTRPTEFRLLPIGMRDRGVCPSLQS